MPIRTEIFEIGANGEGSASVEPGRLVALESDGAGSAFWMTNRGKAFNIGDRLEGQEEFVEGRCVVHGATPGGEVLGYFRF